MTAALALTAACGEAPMDEIRPRRDGTWISDWVHNDKGVLISHGMAAGLTVEPIAEGNLIRSTVSLSSTDTLICDVEHVAGNQFILLGASPGEATLQIVEVSTGAQIDMPVTVFEQAF